MDKHPLSSPNRLNPQYHEFWQVHDLESPELLPDDLSREEIGTAIPVKCLFAKQS